jgi:hypothetical protein
MESLDQEHVSLGDRRFGLVFAVIFLGIFGIRWLVAGLISGWALIAAGCFLALAVLAPGILMPVNRIWQKLARLLGAVTNCLVLGIIFYGVIWPIGTLMRMLGHDPMARDRSKEVETYFTRVRRQADAETFGDQF